MGTMMILGRWLAAAALCLAVAALCVMLSRRARAEGPVNVAVTQTVQTLTAATDAALTGTGGGLRLVCVQNIGTGLVNLAFGTAATAGSGYALNAAGGAGQGGGAICWDSAIPSNVIHAISTAGSTVVTLVGK